MGGGYAKNVSTYRKDPESRKREFYPYFFEQAQKGTPRKTDELLLSHSEANGSKVHSQFTVVGPTKFELMTESVLTNVFTEVRVTHSITNFPKVSTSMRTKCGGMST